MSHLPYIIPMPRSFIDCIVAAISGEVGSISSTSTAACSCQRNIHDEKGLSHTDWWLRGPMSVYRSPYSAVVTGALDLITE
jgi:hypothetical protein